jgi:hypothetical protein
MSESQELKKVRDFITSGQHEKALPLLWELYASKSSEIKLTAAMNLLVALNGVTENKKLLAVTNEAIKLATAVGRNDERTYLLSKKAEFLFRDLSLLTYRQGNLKLAARVFHWLDFSLEKDKKEYDATIVAKDKLEKEISSLERDVLAAIQSSKNHYLRGLVFMSLGDMSIHRFLFYQLDLMTGGRLKSKIMNLYFVGRWHLKILIGFDRNARQKIREAYKTGINYFEESIKEFKAGNLESDLARAFYNLAVQYTLTYYFSKAGRCLKKARQLAEMRDEKVLLIQINELEKRIKDKNKHPRDYVEELGLDLPQ